MSAIAFRYGFGVLLCFCMLVSVSCQRWIMVFFHVLLKYIAYTNICFSLFKT